MTHHQVVPEDQLRHYRVGMILAALGFLMLALLGVLHLAQDGQRDAAAHADSQWRQTQITALTDALTAEQEHQRVSGVDPVAPPPDEILDDPEGAVIEEPGPVSQERLTTAAREALAELMPGEVDAAVSRYVSACVASGDCVGPAGATGPPGDVGPQGATGLPPGPDDVAAAVLAVCSATLDCEATPEEIAEAVANYCGQPSEPCGKKWTEEQIYRIANHAVVDYLLGRPCYGESLNEMREHPDDPSICYMSVG